MRGVGRAKRYYHTLRRQVKRGAVILMYHRVAELPSDPYQLAVTPERFTQHMAYIQRTCQPMRLPDLIEALEHRSLPRRAVAVTFDDGYADNYLNAYPLLKSARIPATIFIVGRMIDSLREFWGDDLERVILAAEHLPPRLTLRIGDREYDWTVESIEQRQQAHYRLHNLLKTLSVESRDRALRDLAQWAGLDQAGRPDYRAMTKDQLIEIAGSHLIDIGGHTLSHPRLSSLPAADQHMEIVEGRQQLESLIGKRLETFAYPYGGPVDFTDETAALVQAAGFRAACTTAHGSVESGDDLFRLRRCAVFDWNISKFMHQLDSFFVARG